MDDQAERLPVLLFPRKETLVLRWKSFPGHWVKLQRAERKHAKGPV
jgi:hypothetical protein